MGLFDLFRKKEQETETTQPKPTTNKYLGDLEKTQIIFDLIRVPAEERDEQWQRSFLTNIVEASFRCGDPQVVAGPDGFPYVQLLMPKPNESFQCYVIDHMKDDFLLASGYGVVINPDAGQPDWVLSYGDIMNLDLNGSFYTSEPTPFSSLKEDETIEGDEKVLVAQPSELILTELNRTVLREFLLSNGVKSPKMLMMIRHGENASVSQELVFNLTPEDFESEEVFRSVMQRLGWFLPRHYAYVGMREDSLTGSFMPL